MVYSKGLRLILLFTKHTKIMEIEKRYLVSQNLLSMVVLVLRRLLHMEDRTVQSADIDDGIPAGTRRLGFEMCRDLIGGVWADIAEDEFHIKPLSGGLTNYLYVCSLPPDVPVPENQPQAVLLRVYGNIATSSNFVVQNSVIFALMSEKGLGPKLYGMNPKARIEELVPAECLRTADLAQPNISRQIARKLALFHSLDMPLCKEPRFLNDTMDSWMQQVNGILKKKHSRSQESFMQKFRNYNLVDELKALKSILAAVTSPVVFSHNDLQEGEWFVHIQHTGALFHIIGMPLPAY
ncbi:CHKA-like protein [Mya arenaria]|uniref:CHKA-like protein n=1 Tax=Mya arenaria TaxID=6604 RepID=A0ABY7E426_MYAAR|nr:CHKA-like protein [Mya arenaria]